MKPQFTDRTRRAFLDALDRSDVSITKKAEDIIEYLAEKKRFTKKERVVIEKLLVRYGPECGF